MFGLFVRNQNRNPAIIKLWKIYVSEKKLMIYIMRFMEDGPNLFPSENIVV